MEANERILLGLGERFPKLTVKTTRGMKTLPDDYAGKWFVLFSHPGDFTPVCTTEFVAFQQRVEKFKEMNCELIGHSIDQVFAHIKWEEWIKEKLDVEITFPIIADSMGDVAKTLGMIHPGKGSNSVRAVFIVDDKGLVRIMLYYPQEIGRNMDEILRAVEAMQVSDKNNVATPANWPNNELLGDKVIIPPASDIDTAAERLKRAEAGEFECRDWWFCYKSL
jgi:peroxiredoxin (alkyl hydroperoxide reductase subunit C)